MGIPDSKDGIPSTHVDAILQTVIKSSTRPDSSFKYSMLLDMERGLPLEVEVIFGEVVRLAREHQVNIPVRSHTT